jgi:hypothetical protein
LGNIYLESWQSRADHTQREMERHMAEILRVSDRQKRVLIEMISPYESEYLCSFDTLATYLQMERRDVRNICRALARKGLAKLVPGFSNQDDGMLAGSGYMLTKTGYQFALTNEATT